MSECYRRPRSVYPERAVLIFTNGVFAGALRAGTRLPVYCKRAITPAAITSHRLGPSQYKPRSGSLSTLYRRKLVFLNRLNLLPTRSRCLDRLYSLLLFMGSLQDLQRQYLHDVPHNNASTGRSCWYGRNSLFSAAIPPMRLARDMPPDWKISQRVSSSSLHH
jgi:hypothetical protein